MNRRPHRIFIACALAVLLSGCAAQKAISTGQPISLTDVQNDLAAAGTIMKEGGCLTAIAATTLAPIVQVEMSTEDFKVLNAVDASGKLLCTALIPPTVTIASPAGTTLGVIVPTPAAPAAPTS